LIRPFAAEKEISKRRGEGVLKKKKKEKNSPTRKVVHSKGGAKGERGTIQGR